MKKDGKMSISYCKKTPIKKMGFSQRSSCKAQGLIKRSSKKLKGKYVVSPKYKSKNRSLYAKGKKRSKVRSGYGDEKKAQDTIKNIKKYNKKYQYQVINTMYNRAKYHANQTKDMRKAMVVFKKWLNKYKSDGNNGIESIPSKENEKIIEVPKETLKFKKIKTEFKQKFKNSVMQLVCSCRKVDSFNPWLYSNDYTVYGSGFIIDIDKGLIITNAHVVSDTFYIVGKLQPLGSYMIDLEVISICIEKDIGLCKIKNDDDINKIKNLSNSINMVFSDSFQLNTLDEVYTIGYPFGQTEISVTQGAINSFDRNNNKNSLIASYDDEDNAPFIVTQVPIYGGNSGGPLINEEGNVVGIMSAGMLFAQNVTYAIGTRTIFSVYDEMIKPLNDSSISMPYIIKLPKYGFLYNNTNLLSSEMGNKGIYINKVFENSAFKEILTRDDILLKISFSNKFVSLSCFDVDREICNKEKGEELNLEINNDSFIQNDKISQGKSRFVLKEIFDMIPIGTKIKLTILRNNIEITKEIKYNYTPCIMKKRILTAFEHFEYVLFCGMCISQLTENHLNFDNTDDLQSYFEDDDRFKNFLIITKIFPNTQAYRSQIFHKNIILSKVNNKKVETIEDLKDVIKYIKYMDEDKVTFLTDKDEKMILSRSKCKEEDTKIEKQYSLKSIKFLT
jgi:S1-C subfamily serine protease